MHQVIVMGIDANSKKLAMFWEDEKVVNFDAISLNHNEPGESPADAFRAMSELFAEYSMADRSVVYMEAPVMGVGGPGSTIPQAYVEGAVMAACGEFGIPIRLINNQTWKKSALGRGSITKDEVMKRLSEQYPDLYNMIPLDKHERPDQDLVDAAAIYVYGKKRIALTNCLKRRANKDG